jgi:TPR repeat protein
MLSKHLIKFAFAIATLTSVIDVSFADISPDLQHRDDTDIFQQEFADFADPPPTIVAERMNSWANAHPSDAPASFWAARAALKGWTASGITDGLARMRQAAAQGSTLAQATWGGILCSGASGVTADPSAGLTFIRGAVDMRDGFAMEQLGELCLSGAYGVPHDLNAACNYFKNATEAGYEPAIFWWAVALFRKGDENLGLAVCRRAADAGDVRACKTFYSQLLPNDPAARRLMLRRGIILNNGEMARAYAANLLLARIGLTRDDGLAALLLWSAAWERDPVAASLLARARLEGLWGVPRDPDRGYRELTALATPGTDPSGCAAFLLGLARLRGISCPIDTAEAQRLLRTSGELKFPPALAMQVDRPATATTQEEHSRAGTPETPLQQVLAWAAECVQEFPSTSSLVPTDPVASDRDRFADYWYRLLPIPPDAVKRTLDRANSDPADTTDAAWVALLAVNGNPQLETPDAARIQLQRCAKSNDPAITAIYAYCMRKLDNSVSWELAWKLLQASSDAGDPSGMALFGQLIANGTPGHPADYDAGIKLQRAGVDHGFLTGAVSLAKILADHGESGNALHVYEMAASKGDPVAAVRLQRLYLGMYTLPGLKGYEPPEAWENLFVRPALLNFRRSVAITAAFVATAGLQHDGLPDLPVARLLIRRAAAHGDFEGQAMLADAIAAGRYGIHADAQLGVAELRDLCELDPTTQSDPEIATDAILGRGAARFALGRLLFDGETGVPDHDAGLKLIQQAADDHNVEAIRWLEGHK